MEKEGRGANSTRQLTPGPTTLFFARRPQRELLMGIFEAGVRSSLLISFSEC